MAPVDLSTRRLSWLIAFCAVIEGVVKTMECRLSNAQFSLEPTMDFNVPSKPFEVVEDNEVPLIPMGIKVSDKCLHRWPIEEAAGNTLISKDVFNN